MPAPVLSDQDFGGVARILNLPDGTLPQHPATVAQLSAQIEGISWKDSVRVASTANINLASPGATIDGITMTAGDRFLAKDQTTVPTNGIYVWNGAATPATRAADASTFAELEAARVDVEEGTTNGGTSWRQTQVNGVIETNNVVWTAAQSAAPGASETVAGVAEASTQAEVDAGTAGFTFVRPATLAAWSGRMRQQVATIGDGSATQIDVTHNFATRDLQVSVWETGGTFREIRVETRLPDTNTVRFVFAAAPAVGAYRVVVQARAS